MLETNTQATYYVKGQQKFLKYIPAELYSWLPSTKSHGTQTWDILEWDLGPDVQILISFILEHGVSSEGVRRQQASYVTDRRLKHVQNAGLNIKTNFRA